MKPSRPLVSVIVPTYNRGGRVRAAIDSALGQDLGGEEERLEVVVVDDGSTDDTPRVLEEAYGHDDRVVLIRQENGGVSAARNRGIDAARGRYVALLDSDDRLLPDSLRARAEVLEATPEADMVMCDALLLGDVGEDGEPRTLFQRSRWRAPDSMEAMCDGAYGLPSAMMFRGVVFRSGLRFDTSWPHMEDTELLFRFCLSGHEAVMLDRVLIEYDAEPDDQRLSNHREAMLEGNVKMLERFAPHVKRHRWRYGYRLARRRAQLLMLRGRFKEARRDLLRWLLYRPWSRKARRHLWRSLRAR